ncbi:sensor histidine kinase KdpD [Magnetospirillum sp. SS-4]|uniref:sensor histidine kinase n=1 Tax=Magnetospirillum sp. SS-4 TaxID=2681465 RepID=UPI001385683C|nr:HAMP domain-containing sensor histidine kinase [Magnetospirillum sp. SS-4]CAA7612798.1 putative histidine kinase [Magnetospirillum sp. SS-4]
MTGGQGGAGLILRCDGDGVVVEILHEGAALAGLARRGRPLAALVEESSFTKALDFVADLRRQANAYNWEMNVVTAGGVESFRFSGAVDGDGMIVAVVPTDGRVDTLIEELARINSSHVTVLRQLFKERRTAVPPPDAAFFESMTQLNNELLNTQRDLAKANATLKAANEVKNRLFGILAHDLRSPLGVVSGFAELLKMVLEGRIGDKEMSYLDNIHTSASYMLALVEDTLSMSAIEAGRLHLERRQVDFGAMVVRVAGLLSLPAERKGIALVAQVPDGPLHLDIDATRMEQVLHNLIGNAVKFSHAGGRIRIWADVVGGEARLRVSDAGVGMSAGELASLFEPFSRSGKRGTAGEDSTGLGLHICQRIVLAHGGRIEVDSDQENGTTVTVSLPA